MRAMSRTALLFVGLAASLALAAPPARIVKLKPTCARTPLVEKGRARARIVVPQDPRFRAAGERLRDAVRKATGVTLPIVSDREIVHDGKLRAGALEGSHLIALGNVNRNRLLRCLFGGWYVVADSIYPGEGGYVVRTVHDPFAKGVNVVALCGSDPAGVAKAVDVFIEKHLRPKGRDLALPEPVVDVVFTAKRHRFFLGPDRADYVTGRMPQHQPASFHRDLFRRIGFVDAEGRVVANPKGDLGKMLNRVFGAADSYFRRGDAELLALMKGVVTKNRDLLRDEDRLAKLPFDVAVRGGYLWDRVEEESVWTDEERILIVNALLASARHHRRLRPMHEQVREGCVQCMDENHGTGSMVCDLDAWRYLNKYYPDVIGKEAAYWLKVARACYLGQASTFQICEDGAGYLCANPSCSLYYACRAHDPLYVTRGVAASKARFIALACVNNPGLATGFGDAPDLIPMYAFNALARAAWACGDAKLRWVVRNALHPASGLRVSQRCLVMDLEAPATEPKDWTGVIQLPLYEMPLAKFEGAKTPVFAPERPVAPNLFNKIVFKENWRPEGQYLLLDGASSGSYRGLPITQGHCDADVNTIINYCDRGRLWLMDHTYSGGAFQNHSGVYVTLDGVKHCYPGGFARLVGMLDTKAFGVTETTFGRWRRAILWKKGRYFVVLDEVEADRDGVYFARATFKALGEHTLEGKALRLSQKGRFCKVVTDGGGRLSVRIAHEGNHRYLSTWYHDAPPKPRYLRVDKRRRMKRGERLGFVTLLAAWKDPADANAVTLKPLGEGEALIVDRDGPALARLGHGESPRLSVVTPQAVHALGARSLADGAITATSACDLALDLETDALRVRTTETVRLSIKPSPAEVEGLGAGARRVYRARDKGAATLVLEPGVHVVRLKAWAGKAGVAAYCKEALRQAAPKARAWTARLAKEGRAVSVKGLRARRTRLGAPVHAFALADLNGDGRPEWIVGGARSVFACAANGRKLWEAKTGGPVGALAVGDTDGDGRPEIVAGCDDHKVYLLDAKDKRRWAFTCRASRSPLAGPPKVDQVWIEDLDGDGRPEVVAVANYVHVLGVDGALRWERFARRHKGGAVWGDAVTAVVADLVGDVRKEVFVLYNDSYPFGVLYDATGASIKGGRDGKYPAPSVWRTYMNPPRAAAAVEVRNGPARRAVLVATDFGLAGYWPGRVGPKSTALSVKGAVTGLHLYRGSPELGPVVLSAGEMTEVRSWRRWEGSNGRLRYPKGWTHVVGEPITALLGARLGGRDLAFLGTADGNVAVLDLATGAPVGEARLQGATVRALEQDGDTVLTVKADGLIARLSLR